MGKINSKQKGNRWEREFSRILRERGFEARRGQQFSGLEGDADVVHSIDLGKHVPHFECKHVEALNQFKAMEQAEQDCINSEDSRNFPVVVHKKNRKEPLVYLRLEDFLNLLEEIIDLNM